MATVRDILQVVLPSGSTIAAGVEGLSQTVAWVCVINSYPPLSDDVGDGDFVLLRPMVRLSEAEQIALVHELASLKVAALGLVVEPSPAVAAAADECRLPVLVMPSGVNVSEVQRTAVALVFHQRGELERRGVLMYRQMAQLVAAGRGVGAIINELSEITGKTVTLQDQDFSLRFYVGPPVAGLGADQMRDVLADGRELQAWLRGVPLVSTSPPIRWFELPVPGLARFVAPVIVRDTVLGYVSVLGQKHNLTELDRVATGRAASVCAIALDKERAVVEAESKVSGEFLQDLLEGNFLTEESAVRRGTLLGYDLTAPFSVVVIKPDPPTAASSGPGTIGATPMASLVQSLRSELPRRSPRALLHVGKDLVAILWPTSNNEVHQLRQSIESLCQQVVRLNRASVSAGLSRVCHGPRDLPRAYREAVQTLNIAQTLLGGNRVAYVDDFLIYRLLFPLQGSRELIKFYEESIGRLVDFDRRRNGELTKTLATFFACHGNVNQTGKLLFLHRNAVAYRLKRIEAITGLSLQDPDHRLALQLGLKVKAIV